MPEYSINKVGKHIIHNNDFCNFLPELNQRIEFFAINDEQAIEKAADLYEDVICCQFCMLENIDNK